MHLKSGHPKISISSARSSYELQKLHGPLIRYVKLRVAHAPAMPGTFSPPTRVSDPDMHHGMCRDACQDRWLGVSFEVSGGENVPGISGTTHNFPYLTRRPWQGITRLIRVSCLILHYSCHMAHCRFAPSQWETALLCNDVSHWLGASLESALILCIVPWTCAESKLIFTLVAIGVNGFLSVRPSRTTSPI